MYKKYFLSVFSQFFFPLFIVLFFISSVILLITIAGSSHVVKLHFMDLLFLFLYSLPNTVFFIIPITFFASCVLCISRLSYDYEMLVFFSLGIRPFELVKTFFPLTLIVSLTSLVFSLGAVPISKRAFDNFLERKKVDVDINIRAGEFGQKIGDWLVYVKSAKDRVYQDLILFSTKGLGFENFISANEGKITNQQGIFTLALKNGESYMAQDEEFRKVMFEHMNIRTQVGEAPLSGYDLVEYWKNAFNGESESKAKRFVKAVLVSIFPLLSLFLIPLIGIANPRYHKNFSAFFTLGSILLFYICVYIFVGENPFLALAIIPLVWFFGSYILYTYKIKPLY
ncbi:LptF/LptG family permease [Helicobacter cholecystus]|uniref:LptF/LptG family permease n=1 Tax=Helicobacter cholecystus TaxID=45498 RepID=A0A3D8IW65_9HELI|nr:LptF/LptG family permease [Helicobacter cholecystus]RDU69529.1 LptF/LptG family permease [Helicobacter cholecystus]VEJ24084.1 YjgP/YjgQ family putative permease [Helicobacter cholecystus]